ncbi:NapD protein, subunit of nitrate reductase [Vibrio ichthyoenteri ATCC 700023]|uniref:Chaperone NapD n=1 Tax=Vibrio ichthyoenteri ATCC 700023 TaxID=870968 RepID=F9S344_9VIBR|nr:chaperone NapD [Vibrio ichthyoenteri]EGU38255.1 NapD protein, subunit of nitrate reductase [Vibrio ichthyoenteri ATCC 700023]
MPKNEVHISSLVVHTSPDYLATVKAQINDIENAEVYGDSPEGKMVVVLETRNHGFITDTIDVINNLPHVLNTVMVYHQIETDLDECETNSGNQQSQVEGEV